MRSFAAVEPINRLGQSKRCHLQEVVERLARALVAQREREKAPPQVRPTRVEDAEEKPCA